jgi:hypothetical protein
MTSKPQSTTTAKPPLSLAEAVSAALTSHEYDDVVGPVAVNMVDALMAIATAIHRLAISQEVLNATQERLATSQETAMKQAAERNDMIAAMMGSDRPGHA